MVVKSTCKGNVLFETEVGNHKIKTDVPAGFGGEERVLLPPQLFIASISSCVAAIVGNFCKGRRWDIKDMSV